MAITWPTIARIAGDRRARTGWWSSLPDLSLLTRGEARKSPLNPVHPLDAVLRHQHHLAGLHAGFPVQRRDIRLYHDRHSGAERLIRHRSARAAGGAEDRRQVAAAI